jgi:REP element-mobilizing transposase RayT
VRNGGGIIQAKTISPRLITRTPCGAGEAALLTTGHTYIEFRYHIVWATRRREPHLTDEVETLAYQYIRQRCGELGVFVYALNGMPDHIHLVCSIPPRLSVADTIEKLKGACSHYVNHQPEARHTLYWQAGYFGLSFCNKELASVMEYVENQKQRHADGRLWPSLERLGPEPHGETPGGDPAG